MHGIERYVSRSGYPVLEDGGFDPSRLPASSPRSLRPPLPSVAETSSTLQTNVDVDLNPDCRNSDVTVENRLEIVPLERLSSADANRLGIGFDFVSGVSRLGVSSTELPQRRGVVVEVRPATWKSRCLAILSWRPQNSHLWLTFCVVGVVGYFLGFLTTAVAFRCVK